MRSAAEPLAGRWEWLVPADQDVAGTVSRGPGGPALLDARAGLQEAFRAEVAERLPRLEAAGPGCSSDVVAAALRDAHSLVGSAVVLGQPGAARVARSVHAALEAGELAAVPAQVQELRRLLAGWRA